MGRARAQVREVGGSLEGWAAGDSIPCDASNAEKLHSRLAELPDAQLCRHAYRMKSIY